MKKRTYQLVLTAVLSALAVCGGSMFSFGQMRANAKSDQYCCWRGLGAGMGSRAGAFDLNRAQSFRHGDAFGLSRQHLWRLAERLAV